MLRRRATGSLPSDGLTPLLDTLFILLFSLLALSDMREEEREQIRIQLPEVEAGDGAGGEDATPIVFVIDAESAIRLDDEELPTREDLDRALEGRVASGAAADALIEIRADRQTEHGVAIALLQHLRLRGFQHIQLLATGYEQGSSQESGAWR